MELDQLQRLADLHGREGLGLLLGCEQRERVLEAFLHDRVLDARKVQSPALMSTVVVLALEGFIWEETNRSQMMEYSRNSSEVRLLLQLRGRSRHVRGADCLMGILRALARRIHHRLLPAGQPGNSLPM